jgi:hypothetical protein
VESFSVLEKNKVSGKEAALQKHTAPAKSQPAETSKVIARIGQPLSTTKPSDSSKSGSSYGFAASAAVVPDASPSGSISSGTGSFVQPGEMSASDSLSAPFNASHADTSQGLLLGSQVDLSHLASPDDTYLAAVENQRVIIRDRSGTILFKSPVQWEDDDTVQLTQWATNNQLLYVVKRGNGDLFEYLIDLTLQQELRR